MAIMIVSYPHDKKFTVIKLIRAAIGFDLIAAKRAAENLPFTINFLSSHNGYSWEDIASELRSLGAEIKTDTIDNTAINWEQRCQAAEAEVKTLSNRLDIKNRRIEQLQYNIDAKTLTVEEIKAAIAAL